MTKRHIVAAGLALVAVLTPPRVEAQRPSLPYCVVDTGQKHIYSSSGQLLKVPKPGEPFFGQDAQYESHPPAYVPSGDGLTVYDTNTGLTWQRSPDTNGDGTLDSRDKLTLAQARKLVEKLNATRFGGFSDWRLPTIKELYSLIIFTGIDPRPDSEITGLAPFIDAKYFQFVYGDTSAGERAIDAQYWSSTRYVGLSPDGKTFGVNFADGRIKGYAGNWGRHFVRCVRGNPNHGKNDFRDNGDGTITDRATGLMWSKADSGKGMNWEAALGWTQSRNKENHLGHNDWRLPSAKELQSMVDYTRSPDTTSSGAIDPAFTCTPITNEAGQADYPCYWTATTHGVSPGRAAVYVAFGKGLGYIGGAWRDVHGAGCQRSDPKAGDPANFPYGRGPQGDAIRILNFVRLVRSVDPKSIRLVKPDLTPIRIRQPAGNGAGLTPDGPIGPPGLRGGFRGGRPSDLGGPVGGFHLIPPFAAELMSFTPEQQKRIAELEKETKAKLYKILTPEQQKTLEQARPPGLEGPNGRSGPFGPGRGQRGQGGGLRGGNGGPDRGSLDQR
jgi:hypothetical protein